MKKISITLLGLLLLVVSITLGSSYYYHINQQSPLILSGNVDIRTVNMSFRVNGRLLSLNVDEGDKINRGDLLGKLDDAAYIIAKKEADASVAAAQAQLDLLLAGYRDEEITQARAMVDQQQAAFNYADSFYKRQQRLRHSSSVSANDLDNAQTTRNQALAALNAAKDKLNQYVNGNRPQQIDQARASVTQAQAKAAQAALNLQDTELYAPSSGVILTRPIEPGTMVSAGSTVLSLSLTTPVWIRAYIDECNLAHAIPGTAIFIYTDGQPNKAYHGKIGFVSPVAEFTPKSVETPELRSALVYRLRIIVTDPDPLLRQGMPVTLYFSSVSGNRK